MPPQARSQRVQGLMPCVRRQWDCPAKTATARGKGRHAVDEGGLSGTDQAGDRADHHRPRVPAVCEVCGTGGCLGSCLRCRSGDPVDAGRRVRRSGRFDGFGVAGVASDGRTTVDRPRSVQDAPAGGRPQRRWSASGFWREGGQRRDRTGEVAFRAQCYWRRRLGWFQPGRTTGWLGCAATAREAQPDVRVRVVAPASRLGRCRWRFSEELPRARGIGFSRDRPGSGATRWFVVVRQWHR